MGEISNLLTVIVHRKESSLVLNTQPRDRHKPTNDEKSRVNGFK